MTKLLRDALKQVEQLPDGEQDAAAAPMRTANWSRMKRRARIKRLGA